MKEVRSDILRADDGWVSVDSSLDPGSSPGASTKQLKTKILSTKSSGNVKTGAFAVLRVEIVLSRDVRDDSCGPILWTGFPARSTHRAPVFSLPPFSLSPLDFSG